MSILDYLLVVDDQFHCHGRLIESGNKMQLKTRWSWIEVTVRVVRRDDGVLDLLAVYEFDGIEFIHNITYLDEVRWP